MSIEIVELTWGPAGYERDQVYDMTRRPGETDNELLLRAATKFIDQRGCYPRCGRICRGQKSYRVTFAAPSSDAA